MADALSGAGLIAPNLVMFESANIIGRHEMAGLVSADQTAQAHADLLDLSIEPRPYDLLAVRVWELRTNRSSYDTATSPSPNFPTHRWSRSTDASVEQPTSGAR